MPLANNGCYLTDENGCFVLTANGCRILLGPAFGASRQEIVKDDWTEREDEEILIIIMAFMETV
jgi:hypothetical protein